MSNFIFKFVALQRRRPIVHVPCQPGALAAPSALDLLSLPFLATSQTESIATATLVFHENSTSNFPSRRDETRRRRASTKGTTDKNNEKDYTGTKGRENASRQNLKLPLPSTRRFPENSVWATISSCNDDEQLLLRSLPWTGVDRFDFIRGKRAFTDFTRFPLCSLSCENRRWSSFQPINCANRVLKIVCEYSTEIPNLSLPRIIPFRELNQRLALFRA